MIAFVQRLRLLSLSLLLSAALAVGGLLCLGLTAGLDGPLPLLAITAATICAMAGAACNAFFILRVGAALPRPSIGHVAGAGLLALAMLLFGPFAAFAVPVLIVGVAVALVLGLVCGAIGFALAYGLITVFAV